MKYACSLDARLGRLADAAKRNHQHYAALPSNDSIRLIEFQSGTDFDMIGFFLVLIPDYRDATAYSALSYCWGDVSDAVEVSCNGDSFLTTGNLHAALRNLRSHKCPRLLWVDAICIDQHVVAERNQQVSIMGQIYVSRAEVGT